MTNNIIWLRRIGFAEGISWGLLCITMLLKYAWAIYQPNKIVGMVHGFLFIAYVLGVIYFKIYENWDTKKTVLALLASIVPFGTFWADAKLFREENK